jgi:Domain of unknown function (DUF1772)
MNSQFLQASLFLSTFLSGLYAGIGLFTLMGGNPAIKKMSNAAFAEFWQQVDRYMAARMAVFGPVMMLSLVVSIVFLFLHRDILPAWLMIAALLIIVGDLAFTLSVNHPLNRLIQGWDLRHLPAHAGEIKWKVVKAFNIRIVLMFLVFLFVLLSVWGAES